MTDCELASLSSASTQHRLPMVVPPNTPRRTAASVPHGRWQPMPPLPTPTHPPPNRQPTRVTVRVYARVRYGSDPAAHAARLQRPNWVDWKESSVRDFTTAGGQGVAGAAVGSPMNMCAVRNAAAGDRTTIHAAQSSALDSPWGARQRCEALRGRVGRTAIPSAVARRRVHSSACSPTHRRRARSASGCTHSGGGRGGAGAASASALTLSQRRVPAVRPHTPSMHA